MIKNTEFFKSFSNAIFSGDIDAVKTTIEAGGDINEVSDNDLKPFTLLSLAEEHAPGIVEEMIQLGADVSKTLEYLKFFYGEHEALHVAINRRWELSARLLAEAITKEDVDRTDEGMRNTPLVCATRIAGKKPELALTIIKILIEKGADPLIKNGNGYSAIDVAKDHTKIERWSPEIGKEVLDLFGASS